MSFPNKETRKKCWDSRDRYWECLDSSPDQQKKCSQLKKIYETECPASWVKHFDRKYEFLKFKEKIEKEGYDPIDTNKASS